MLIRLRGLACIFLGILLWSVSPPAAAQTESAAADSTADSVADSVADSAADPFAEFTQGATVQDGAVTAYTVGGRRFLALSPGVFDRVLMWHAEVARYPAGAVALGGTEIASNIVQLERRPGQVFIRSLSSDSLISGGSGHYFGGVDKVQPIDISVENAQISTILVALDILAEQDDGTVLVEVTEAFGGVISGYSTAGQFLGTGFTAAAVDPSRSFLSELTVFPENIFFRTQLTYIGEKAGSPMDSISIEVAHTIALLPAEPMAAREFDDRVGFFNTSVLGFETDDGSPARKLDFALRHRLEHADPSAPRPSAPVAPLVYYLSPEIPERWRPYIRQAIEDWQPAFEAAGYTNAIIARDAPTAEQDPDWSPEDVRYNVVRWVSQPFANAMGPNIHDPRSGEILSAHILVWPEVLNLFGDYYYLLMSDLDPNATALPLPEETLGRILRYAVSHEVGHTLGLRHNHRASTAWTTEQLRDPDFTAEFGSTASIMAYGRFNYVARPQDGVEQLFPLIGVYDFKAIAWGYGAFESADALEAAAAVPDGRQDLLWAAAELPAEIIGTFDPRIVTENIGADRIEATRAGMAALAKSLGNIPAAVDGVMDPTGRAAALMDQAAGVQKGFANSVSQMIGGLSVTERAQAPYVFVSVEDQKAAIDYLVIDAVDALGAYSDPDLLRLYRPAGGIVRVEQMASGLITDMLDPLRLRLVVMQNELEPERAFGVEDMLTHVTDAFLSSVASLDDLDAASPQRKAAITAYVAALQDLPTKQTDLTQLAGLSASGIDPSIAALVVAGFEDTDLAATAEAELARLVAALAPPEAEEEEHEEVAD